MEVLQGEGGVQSDGSYVLFSILRLIVFAPFYCLWHQIKKVPVMCETSSRVFEALVENMSVQRIQP